MTKERVLLAGCGDLGMRVAQRLLARSDEVWALRRHPPTLDHGDIHWLRADLTQPESLRKLPHGITQLVYLPTPDQREPEAYRSTFVGGLHHQLDALGRKSLQRVLLVSSSAVYGERTGRWVDEHTAAVPRGFNGEVLLEAEQMLAAQPVTSIALRLAGLYGPGRLQLLQRLRAGGAVVPRTTPHWANRIHVDDAAAAIVHLLALAQPQSLYLGVDNTPLRLDVLYDHLCGLLDAPLAADGPAPAGGGSKRLSHARLCASGFSPRWPDARAGYAALLDVESPADPAPVSEN